MTVLSGSLRVTTREAQLDTDFAFAQMKVGIDLAFDLMRHIPEAMEEVSTIDVTGRLITLHCDDTPSRSWVERALLHVDAALPGFTLRWCSPFDDDTVA